MAATSTRSIATTVIGWVIVAILGWLVLGWVFATLRWILRTLLILVVLGFLLSAYARLSED